MVNIILTNEELKKVFNLRIIYMQEWLKNIENVINWYQRDYMIIDGDEHVEIMAKDLKLGLQYIIKVIDKLFIREGKGDIYYREDKMIDGYEKLNKILLTNDIFETYLTYKENNKLIMCTEYYIDNFVKILKSDVID